MKIKIVLTVLLMLFTNSIYASILDELQQVKNQPCHSKSDNERVHLFECEKEKVTNLKHLLNKIENQFREQIGKSKENISGKKEKMKLSFEKSVKLWDEYFKAQDQFASDFLWAGTPDDNLYAAYGARKKVIENRILTLQDVYENYFVFDDEE
ncbi:hypothetical protein [Vibrio quintilis]|nr:hypothetical protein [Vibrio quintilis]